VPCTALSGPVALCGRKTLNLAARTLTLRPLPGQATPSLLAGRLYGALTDVDPTTQFPMRVTLSPIPAANGSVGRPRTLGPWAPYGPVLSTTYPWRPQISTTDPLSSWTLTMRSSTGRIVGRWTGKAPDREIRGITWTGRDLAGHRLLPGRYHWTLTGTSRYGSLADVLGTGTATGTVRIVTQAPARVTTTSTSRVIGTGASSYRSTTLTSRLTTSRGLPVIGTALTLWKLTARGTWTQVDSAVTSSSGTATWTLYVTSRAVYQIRHAADPQARATTSPTLILHR
jgi:hypothetical protein